MNPTNQDKLKAGIFCESPKAILLLLQSIFFVIPIEQGRFSQEDAVDLDIIFIDDKQVDWPIVQALSDEKPIVFLAENKTLAYEALKYGVVDMILAPYGKKEIALAIQKSMEKIRSCYNSARQNTQSSELPRVKGIYFQFANIKKETLSLDTRKIVYCMADANLTFIYLDDGRCEIGDFPISHSEVMLHGFGLIRSHRKYIVNSSKIEKLIISNSNSRKLKMINYDENLPIARRRWKIVNQHIKK